MENSRIYRISANQINIEVTASTLEDALNSNMNYLL